ncbi:MAG: RagB/SusD family nutrient uptake outer membrane protein [Chitinophagaceae bacterium]|nr:RagB/SusD family nutrient uptake outer membrane protein [Chitinophagaceae bacterium]MCW5928389.1 RagB/SusD family nutrient uptake outer membrane protein [Chitinophagaceae bacterium]
MKHIIRLSLAIGLMATSISCKKSLLELESQGAYSYETYFNNSDALNQAAIATYATLLHNGLWSREYYFIFDLAGYDAKRTNNMQGDLAQLAMYTFGTNQPQIADLWKGLYRMIFRANIVIDRAEAWSPDDAGDQSKVRQYVAEVKFLRAYSYLNIAMLWGDAPLITDYQSMINDNYIGRSPVADIWTLVENDLKDAQNDLPVTYSESDLGRVTRGAATALLGKAYLYQKKWGQAQAELLKLTQAPYSYGLDPSYDHLFSSGNQISPENIFQVMNGEWTDWGIGNQYYVFGGQETWGGKATHSDRAQEYGFNDWNNVYVTTAAVNRFTYPNPAGAGNYTDPRAKSTFYGNAASGGATVYCEQCDGGSKPFPFNAADEQGDYKWKKYQYYNEVETYGGPASSINAQVIRYADVLLMLAETYIQEDNTGSVPLGYINDVRARAGAVAYTTLGNKTSAMEILNRERHLELCGEQSRYFDLIRWGIARATINSERAAEPGDGSQPFQDKHLLFPIPDIEKNYNPTVAAAVNNDWN